MSPPQQQSIKLYHICLFTISVIVCLQTFPLSVAQKFRCNQNDFENMFNRLIILPNNERKFPEKFSDLDEYCRETFKILRQMDVYKKNCLKESMKNIVSVVSYSMRVQTKRICSNRRSVKTKDMISAGNCINSNRESIIDCIDEVAVNFDRITLVENRFKMPNICCQYVYMMKCLENVMSQNGKCSNKMPILRNRLESVMSNFVDTTCGEYNSDTDRCEKLSPLPKKHTITSKSFVFNLANIIDSINAV